MFATILFNFLILVVSIAALVIFSRQRTILGALAVVIVVGVASLVSALGLGGGLFGAMRLTAWAAFVHAPLVLIAMAAVLFSRHRAVAAVAVVIAVLIVGVGVDAFFIEPTWLEVTRRQITSPKLKAPLKIVVIADLQTDVIGPYERDVIARVVAEQPDLILLAGDYLQVHDEAKWDQLRGQLNWLLKEEGFHAPLGIYAVTGNVDYAAWPEIFDGLPVTCVTRTKSFDLARDDIRVTGLSMGDSFDVNTRVADSKRFHICLGHCPNFAMGPDLAQGNVQADLLVAGHTHGGQVRLPLIGPLITLSRVPRSWAAGWTELSGGRRLLVSRGIGMERGSAPRLRFLCRPELVIVEVMPEEGWKCGRDWGPETSAPWADNKEGFQEGVLLISSRPGGMSVCRGMLSTCWRLW